VSGFRQQLAIAHRGGRWNCPSGGRLREVVPSASLEELWGCNPGGIGDDWYRALACEGPVRAPNCSFLAEGGILSLNVKLLPTRHSAAIRQI
jgi:hypothetical protein